MHALNSIATKQLRTLTTTACASRAFGVAKITPPLFSTSHSRPVGLHGIAAFPLRRPQ